MNLPAGLILSLQRPAFRLPHHSNTLLLCAGLFGGCAVPWRYLPPPPSTRKTPCSVLMFFWYPHCGATLQFSKLTEKLSSLWKKRAGLSSSLVLITCFTIRFYSFFFNCTLLEQEKEQLIFVLTNAQEIWMKRYCHEKNKLFQCSEKKLD